MVEFGATDTRERERTAAEVLGKLVTVYSIDQLVAPSVSIGTVAALDWVVR